MEVVLAGRHALCLFSFYKCNPSKHQCIFIVLTYKAELADQNIPELLKKLDCLHEELGKIFQSVSQLVGCEPNVGC